MRHRLGSLVLLVSLVAPATALADPPAHAPAHGRRAKQAPPPSPAKLEVTFDSGLGLSVAVGVPGVFFVDGAYYRERDGRWEMSVDGHGGWSITASTSVPKKVHKARHHPGPAKAKKRRGR